MHLTVRDDAEASRFEIEGDGMHLGHLEYRLIGDVYTLHHTWTEPAQREHGVATELVRWALEEIDARGGTVYPTCPFVQTVIGRYPQYQRLVDGATPPAYCPWRTSA